MVSTTNGGTLEAIAGGQASPHFQLLSEYLNDPRLFLCPTDKTSKRPRITRDLMNEASAIPSIVTPVNRPAYVLSGDRHLQSNGTAVKPGSLVLTPNAAIGSTRELHRSSRTPGGNLVFLMSCAVELEIFPGNFNVRVRPRIGSRF